MKMITKRTEKERDKEMEGNHRMRQSKQSIDTIVPYFVAKKSYQLDGW